MLKPVIDWLSGSASFMPFGSPLHWDQSLIWPRAVADGAAGVAYLVIALVVLRRTKQRRDLALRPVFRLLTATILLGALGYFFSLLTLWIPAYGTETVIKAANAAASLIAAAAVWMLVPQSTAPVQAIRTPDTIPVPRLLEVGTRSEYTHTPLPLHVLGATGSLIAVSDRWLELLGFRRDEVLGHPLTEFQAPEAAEAADRDLRRLFEEGETRDVPCRFVCKDGTLLDVLTSHRVEITDGDVRILGALVDMTARLRAESALRESEHRGRLALAAVNSSGSFDWDTGNDLIYADSAFALRFGIDPIRAASGISLRRRPGECASKCQGQNP